MTDDCDELESNCLKAKSQPLSLYQHLDQYGAAFEKSRERAFSRLSSGDEESAIGQQGKLVRVSQRATVVTSVAEDAAACST